MQKYYIVVPWPKEESRLLATIRPFQPEVLKKKKIPFLIVHREICLIIDDCAIDFWRCGSVLGFSWPFYRRSFPFSLLFIANIWPQLAPIIRSDGHHSSILLPFYTTVRSFCRTSPIKASHFNFQIAPYCCCSFIVWFLGGRLSLQFAIEISWKLHSGGCLVFNGRCVGQCLRRDPFLFPFRHQIGTNCQFTRRVGSIQRFAIDYSGQIRIGNSISGKNQVINNY